MHLQFKGTHVLLKHFPSLKGVRFKALTLNNPQLLTSQCVHNFWTVRRVSFSSVHPLSLLKLLQMEALIMYSSKEKDWFMAHRIPRAARRMEVNCFWNCFTNASVIPCFLPSELLCRRLISETWSIVPVADW